MRVKYGNKKTVVDGIRFDSKKEAARYGVLKLRERAGEISGLTLQVSYGIVINDVKVCRYVADFSYMEKGKLVIEDCKGFKTPDYILKKKLMLGVHGIEILET